MVKSICPQLNPCDIADIYFEMKKIKTVSLRNLSRSLSYINKNKDIYGMQRAIYDGLLLGYG
jgi:midasin (ATPase involved in ribosome maturation)